MDWGSHAVTFSIELPLQDSRGDGTVFIERFDAWLSTVGANRK